MVSTHVWPVESSRDSRLRNRERQETRACPLQRRLGQDAANRGPCTDFARSVLQNNGGISDSMREGMAGLWTQVCRSLRAKRWLRRSQREMSGFSAMDRLRSPTHEAVRM